MVEKPHDGLDQVSNARSKYHVRILNGVAGHEDIDVGEACARRWDYDDSPFERNYNIVLD